MESKLRIWKNILKRTIERVRVEKRRRKFDLVKEQQNSRASSQENKNLCCGIEIELSSTEKGNFLQHERAWREIHASKSFRRSGRVLRAFLYALFHMCWHRDVKRVREMIFFSFDPKMMAAEGIGSTDTVERRQRTISHLDVKAIVSQRKLLSRH